MKHENNKFSVHIFNIQIFKLIKAHNKLCAFISEQKHVMFYWWNVNVNIYAFA